MAPLTLEQRLHNAFASQEVENIKTLHAYLHAASHSFEEWDQLWSRSDDITWAHQFGRMVGWDEVWYGSVSKYDADVTGLYLRLLAMYPEVNGKDPRACGLGGLHTLASGVVEVAEDGKTARAFYLTPGSMASTHSPSGKRAGNMLWERYGSDFIYQDGKWLYFHEHVCPDFGYSYNGSDWAHNQYLTETGVGGPSGPGGPGGPGGGPGGPKSSAPKPTKENPPCTDPGPLHRSWSLTQTVQDSVSWPVPYQTMDDNNSYSPGRNDPNKNLDINKAKFMG